MPPAPPQKGGKNFFVILFETSVSIPLRFQKTDLSFQSSIEKKSFENVIGTVVYSSFAVQKLIAAQYELIHSEKV